MGTAVYLRLVAALVALAAGAGAVVFVVSLLRGLPPVTSSATWPPPPAAKLVAEATAVYKGLHTFVIHDNFGDGHASLNTIYWIVAPDELVYQVHGGGDAVIIGTSRWDRPAGTKRWIASAQA